MKMKTLLVATALAGSVTIAMAQNGAGIDPEVHNLPPQRSAPMMGAPSTGSSAYRHSTRRHRSRALYNSMNGNPAVNAKASGGSGTHKGAQTTGSGESTQKVIHNRNGYQ